MCMYCATFMLSESESEVSQLCLTLCDPWTVACLALLSKGFSRQEYWSGLPFPSPGDLPDPGIELGSPALQADSLLSESQGLFVLSICLQIIPEKFFICYPQIIYLPPNNYGDYLEDYWVADKC